MSVRRTLLWLAVLGPWWPALVIYFLPGADALLDLTRGTPLYPLLRAYYTTSPLSTALWFAAVYPVFLYGVSLLLKNCSIFDVHWSLLPPSVYALHFAAHPLDHPHPVRRLLLLAVVWAWGVRLTGNWLLKGGLGFEDFRYLRFRETMSRPVFQLFSFTVLFLLQSAMVVAMCLPFWPALRAPGLPPGWIDALAVLVAGGGVIIEAVADWQLRRFRQHREAQRLRHPEDYEGPSPRAARFLRTGLWRYSRHPNYFGEILVWWGVYLFGVAATGDWLNFTLIGPVTIHALFVGGSVQITEAHELRRKPEYADYQRTTSRILPLPPRA